MLYEIGTDVWVKSLKRRGKVSEANYSHRRAQYLVEFRRLVRRFDGQRYGPMERVPDGDFLTGSSDLRRADWECDGCSRLLPKSAQHDGPRDRDGVLEAMFCFGCCKGWRGY